MKNKVKMNKSNKYLSLLLMTALVACQPNNQTTINQSEVKTSVNDSIVKTDNPKPIDSEINKSVAKPPVTIDKLVGYGDITSENNNSSNSKTLKVSINYSSIRQGFKTQAIDCGAISRIKVAINGINITNPIYANGADVNNTVLASGCNVIATIDNVPFGKARVMTVEAYDSGNVLIPGATMKAVFDVNADPTNVSINYKTTPAAKVIESMISTNDDLKNFTATKVNLADLNTKIDTITVPVNGPNYTYTVHPSLIDASVIAADLLANGGNAASLDETKATYKIASSTVTGKIVGLAGSDKVSIRVDDPASTAQIVDGTFTITNVTPGNWKTYITTESGNTFTYTVTSPITTNTTSSNTTNLGDVTLTAGTKITSISTTSGNVESTFNISGAGFTGITAVKVGGIASEFTINSDTTITVTVPGGIGSGSKTIAITKNSTDYSSPTNFTIDNRTIYVNDNASGTNKGDSWTNAYNSLEIALNKSNSGDTIWVAAGTYKPTTTTTTLTANADGATNINSTISSTSSTFQMNDGVKVYGGFNGNESDTFNVETGTRDFTSTILSGDLNNSNTSDTGDIFTIVKGASNIELDGFSIKHGYNTGDQTNGGGGMYNNASSVKLNNIIFSNNHAVNYAGALYNIGSLLELNNITFSNNTTGDYAGALYNNNSAKINNVRFLNNSSANNGGAVYNRGFAPEYTNVVFSGNSASNVGGAVYNGSSADSIFINTLFYNNSAASRGGAIFNSVSSPNLTNVTFFNNSTTNGSLHNFNNSNPIIKNSIFWNSTIVQSATTGAIISYSDIQGGYVGTGNVDLDPLFVNSISPAISMTASDGLALQSNSPVRDIGTSTDAPDKDITGRTRPVGSGYSMGAYEEVSVTP